MNSRIVSELLSGYRTYGPAADLADVTTVDIPATTTACGVSVLTVSITVTGTYENNC
ncbi:hypothetical protein ACLMAJ_31035 [Nocardia sp. KC 131]|uniref:hypothetical protein n=1 Tax=Nocardia arseniciresistens TaxID=3392119 RepID=UPI00398F573A